MTIKTNIPALNLKANDASMTRVLKNANDTVDYGTKIIDNNVDGSSVSLNINAANDVITFSNKSGKGCNIFGEHNKPTGSYSGNGDATSRTIDTKGLGGAVLVYSASGWSALVGYYGAICFGNGNTSLQYTAAKFQNGVLTLATTETALNRNGTTYYYQVL